jgi:hypothetical protein
MMRRYLARRDHKGTDHVGWRFSPLGRLGIASLCLFLNG